MLNHKTLKMQQDDVHISIEDQEKINKFANHNARMDELKIELDQKKSEMKNMEDAVEEIELCDDNDQIPFLFGDVFLTHDVRRTHVCSFPRPIYPLLLKAHL